jgi:hypothetical protein
MRLMRRLLAAIVLALSVLGVIGCIAGVVTAWVVRADMTRAIAAAETRIATAIERVSAANQRIQLALQGARTEIDLVHAGATNLAPEPEKNRRVAGMLRKRVRQQLGPNIDDLSGRLAIGSDTAIAIGSLLQSLQESPVGHSGRIDPAKLEQMTNQASRLVAAFQKLQAAMGDDDQAAVKQDVISATGDVTSLLQQCETRVDEWQSELQAAGAELPVLKERILGWLTIAAVAVTVVLAWGGVSQVSLATHAWTWLRHS